MSLFLFGIVPPCSVLFTYLCPETRVLDYIWPALFLSNIVIPCPTWNSCKQHVPHVSANNSIYGIFFRATKMSIREHFKEYMKTVFFSSTGKDLVLDHLDDYLACNLIADFSDNHSLFKCQKFHWQLRMRDRKQCALEVTPPSLSVNKGSNWKTNSQLQNTSWVFKASQTYFPKFPKGKKGAGLIYVCFCHTLADKYKYTSLHLKPLYSLFGDRSLHFLWIGINVLHLMSYVWN